MVSGWAALMHRPDSSTDREFEREPLAGCDESQESAGTSDRLVEYHVLGSALEHSSKAPVNVGSRKRARNSRGASRLQRLLVPSSLGVFFLSLIMLVGAIYARHHQNYRVFSWLAREQGYPDFALLMTLLAFASFAASVTGGIGWVSASKPEEHITFCLTPTAIVVSALTFPLAMVVEQGFARDATPLLSQAANEVCESRHALSEVWNCESRPDGQATPSTGLLGDVPAGSADIFFNTTEQVAFNHIQPRAGAAAFVSILEGEDARCSLLASLCVPPPWFQEATACTCRSPSRLADGVQGAFCAAWGPGTDQWCLVAPYVTCGHPGPHPASGLKRSEGPCTDRVESMSQLVYDGVWALHVGCFCASLLGILLLLEALGALDHYRAGRERATQRALSSGAPPGMSPEDVENFEPSEEEWEVLLRAGQGASEEDKLLIYAYYMQSKCGDAPPSAALGCGRLSLAKHEAWSRLRGVPRLEADRLYNEAVGTDFHPNLGGTVYQTNSGL